MDINKVIENLEREIKLLENEGDCVGIRISDEFGFFIQVEEWDDGKEYFVEPNTREDDCFEPIGDSFGVEFGDFDELKKQITLYLEKNIQEHS